MDSYRPSSIASKGLFSAGFVVVAVLGTCLMVACGKDSAGADPGPADAGPNPADGGSRCGNEARESGELCDGPAVECTSLASSYTSGKAPCRADCSGYDVSTCALSPRPVPELVMPRTREPSTWPEALCSKEGDFPFYVKRAASQKWVIRLQGGGGCSGAGCANRADFRVAPFDEAGHALEDRAFPAFTQPDDIPTSFQDANYVELHYCSNDAWTGTRSTPLEIALPSGGVLPFTFSGRHNVRAALEILAQRYGLDDSNPDTRIYFTGSSAGGYGVVHNIDQLAAIVPRSVAGHRVWALSEASLQSTDWKTIDAMVPGDWSLVDNGAHSGLYLEDGAFQAESEEKLRHTDPLCEAARGLEACFDPLIHQPFLSDPPPLGYGIPVAFAANLEDPSPQQAYGITRKQGNHHVFTDGGEVPSEAWGDALAEHLATLRWTYLPRDPAGYHGFSFAIEPTDGTPAYRSVVDAFVSSGEPSVFRYVDFSVVHGDSSQED